MWWEHPHPLTSSWLSRAGGGNLAWHGDSPALAAQRLGSHDGNSHVTLCDSSKSIVGP